MSLGQQWAIVFAVFWIASVWYSYSLGHIRGQGAGLKEASRIRDHGQGALK